MEVVQKYSGLSMADGLFHCCLLLFFLASCSLVRRALTCMPAVWASARNLFSYKITARGHRPGLQYRVQLCKNYANRNCIEKSIYNTGKKDGRQEQSGSEWCTRGHGGPWGEGAGGQTEGILLAKERFAIIIKKSVRIM